MERPLMLLLLLSVALSINIESIDFDNRDRALAEMLLSLNPAPSMIHNNARWLRTAPRMQALDQRPELASADIAAPGRQGAIDHVRNRMDTPILVQGGTLKTWSYNSAAVDRVQVYLTTEGRPLDADIELWQGPDNTPTKMRVYSEDGQARPFNVVIETPQSPNTVAIRNIGQIEFPLAASLIANDVDAPVSDFLADAMTVQGGALRTFPFTANVERVEVMLKTDGRPLNARIELLQGPNNNKQVIELYADDGLARPFFAIIDTMGSGNVVRIVNTAPIEFPMTARVQPHFIDNSVSPLEPVIGGDQ
jgi:hypothetical protein